MKSLDECKQWVRTHEDIFIDLIRMYLGVGLIIKGVYFFVQRDELHKILEGAANQAFTEAVIAHYVIPAHILGGLLLALGLITRVAALAQIPVLVGAVFFVNLPRMMLIEWRQSLEFSALVLFLLIVVFFYGAGRWSLDYVLSKKESHRLQPQSAG